jgi:hypothetical protein
MSLPLHLESRLILHAVTEALPPFYDMRDDYDVLFQGRRVGRINFAHRPYPRQAG